MTAPSGPEWDAAVEAAARAWWAHLTPWADRLGETFEQDRSGAPQNYARLTLAAAFPLIRDAVIRECVAVLRAESDRRFRTRTADDPLGRAYDGGIAGGADVLDGILLVESLLPPPPGGTPTKEEG